MKAGRYPTYWAFAAICGAMCMLEGCADLTDKVTGSVTGAEPLPTSVPGTNGPSDPAYIQAQIRNSIMSCDKYKRELLLASRASNATFDITTTIFSALGTVFTPLSTVHALTAAATVSSGTKTAIDADVYQTATAPLMVEAIQQTYDKDITALREKTDSGGAVSFTDVVAVHSECSLTEAMAQLQSLESKQPTPSPTGAATEPGVNLSALGTVTQTGGTAKAMVTVSNVTDDSVVMKVGGLKLTQMVTSVTDSGGAGLSVSANSVTWAKAGGNTTLTFAISNVAKGDTFTIAATGMLSGKPTGTTSLQFTVSN